MKYLMFFFALVFCSFLMGQSNPADKSTEQVIIDNEKIKVVELTSLPMGDVCGAGMHHHEPHLTVVFSDSKVQITGEDGKSQEIEIKAGTSIWFEADTHAVINSGDKATNMILVYLKE